jgi:hypothetical protein
MVPTLRARRGGAGKAVLIDARNPAEPAIFESGRQFYLEYRRAAGAWKQPLVHLRRSEEQAGGARAHAGAKAQHTDGGEDQQNGGTAWCFYRRHIRAGAAQP